MDTSTFHKQLLDRYVSNVATHDELEVIDQLLRNGELDEMLMMHMQETWQKEEVVFEGKAGNGNMDDALKKFRLWPRIAVAAAIITFISIGLWIYKSRQLDADKDSIAIATNQIVPGKNAATLTLSNGKTIVLSDAKTGVVIEASKITYNDGSSLQDEIIRQSNDDIQTITTPIGGIYQIVLTDGSKIFLNTATVLKFSTTFSSKNRRTVELINGEAYFEVAKDPTRPFIVKSAGQEIEVLGTHFNVSAYDDEPSQATTLIEGAVKVTGGKQKSILHPGQQAVLQNKILIVKNADTDEVMAWVNDDFIFKNEKIESVMRKISRWYDVEVIYTGDLPEDEYKGKISRLKSIKQVLEMLSATNTVHFKIEGRRVTVTK